MCPLFFFAKFFQGGTWGCQKISGGPFDTFFAFNDQILLTLPPFLPRASMFLHQFLCLAP